MQKTTLYSLIFSIFFVFSLSAQSLPLQVGTVSSGGTTALTLSDAQLSAQLSDILNNRSLSNAVIQSATDDMGLFYFIRANVTHVGSTTSGVIIIVLSQSGNTLVFTGDDCTMECSAGLPCGGCFQNIISRCKSQECKCTTESGGCTSTITFGKK
ncbi:MAG: hypothetical protein J0L99_05450 [Chitinophagales bacterium]|nr:hypothetical protein [Chitinophagales bacterium]